MKPKIWFNILLSLFFGKITVGTNDILYGKKYIPTGSIKTIKK